MIAKCRTYLFIVCIPTLSCLSLGSPTLRGEDRPSQELSLTSLQAPCKLTRRWFGTVPMLGWSVWLRCDGTEMLVVHPWNLIGKVEVRSADQALEFARFFSSEDSYATMRMEGLLEIRANNPWCPGLPEALGKDTPIDPKVESHIGSSDARYYVHRHIVTYDQNVYRIVESIRQDGFYLELDRALVYENVTQLGCLHDAP